jgi:hypothetical protein
VGVAVDGGRVDGTGANDTVAEAPVSLGRAVVTGDEGTADGPGGVGDSGSGLLLPAETDGPDW